MGTGGLRVVLVDGDGHERGAYAIEHLADLRVGQELWLDVEGRRTLVRVLRQGTTGASGERVVRAIEVSLRCPFCRSHLFGDDGIGGLLQDADGDFVVCRHCARRVAMERIPTTPPGGPARLRVAADQGGWDAWD